jgi:hypothetical protein
MKNITKKILTTVILTAVISFAADAQTNVSGGIFSNTTWTLANSPYIVTGTVIVFPGDTLTIEPGVTVRFDNSTYLEIRQATLIATGTSTDSITFTSNNPTPTPGIWGHPNYGGIYFNGSNLPSINYWNISYAVTAIDNAQYLPYIKNSTFTYNQTAFRGILQTPLDSCVLKYNGTAIEVLQGNTINEVLNFCTVSNNNVAVNDMSNSIWNNCTIDSNGRAFGGATGQHANSSKFYNCSISYNHDGIIAAGPIGGTVLHNCVLDFNTGYAAFIQTNDSLVDCEIKYNATGIAVQSGNSVVTHCDIEYDTVGLFMNGVANIYCNKICNNISYGLQMYTASNFNVANNYWCTTDSLQIAASIYDGYDNISYGLVNFMPLDTSCAPGIVTSVNEIVHENLPFNIFPNPATSELVVRSPEFGDKKIERIEIYDVLGHKVFSQQSIAASQQLIINVSAWQSGIYIIQVVMGDKISRQKFIRR